MLIYQQYLIQAKVPGVARGIKKKSNFEEKKFVFEKKIIFENKSICLAVVTPRVPMGSLKKFSQFGPAVWPAIADIYTYERRALLYS